MWNNDIANSHHISTNELLSIWAAGKGVSGVPTPTDPKFYRDGMLTEEGMSVYEEAEKQRRAHISSQLKRKLVCA